MHIHKIHGENENDIYWDSDTASVGSEYNSLPTMIFQQILCCWNETLCWNYLGKTYVYIENGKVLFHFSKEEVLAVERYCCCICYNSV